MKPRVAIGLPVYNAERYLREALDAILAQTYADFTLLISDNASTDGTEAICQSYAAKDRRIRYHRNQRNLGASRNYNRVFQLSSAEYFKWAPYDDLIAPRFLETCVRVLDENADAVLCYTKATVIDESGAFVVDYDPGPDTSSVEPHERFRNLVLHPEYAVQMHGLLRASAVRRTSFYGSFPSSDEVLLAELALLGRFHEVSERLYVYRRHDQQSTTKPQRLRMPFFDTSLAGKMVLPKWMYFLACLRVIRNAPIDAAQRARCYAHMLRWVVVPPHLRAMGKDVLLAAGQLAGRVLVRSSPVVTYSRRWQGEASALPGGAREPMEGG